ncbi:TniQ family protein [Vogesella sp. LIG4]|uniref:TniQ family protein n=1 Tax=Vogesella sp. LIG4 TaxID=1192162 RepID=UPI0008200701|nr:TniQ family protein [Vogesella sp. LIG4]SCK11645.1 TniQ protein [Vogesella sp. LIG4]
MSLIVTYAPHVDESGLGYYRRLVTDNVLSGWQELAGIAGVQRSRHALFGHADLVASQLGLEFEWALRASQKEEESRSWGRLYRVHTDAVCPVCLEEDGYLRQSWEHAYVTACPKHRIKLVDCCNDCGESLTQHRDHVDRCSCGQDLQRLPREEATPAQLWLSALIASHGKHASHIEPRLKRVDISTLGQVVATLCLSADPTRAPLHRSLAYPRTVTEAATFLAPLEGLLANWPAGFQVHVERRIEVGTPEARTLNTLLGPWYIGLRKACQGTALEVFLQVIIEVAAEKFDGILGLDSAKNMAEDVTEYLRSAEAAKVIGVSASRLHKAIQDGECIHRTRRFGTRGQVYELPRAEVDRIQQRRNEWISLDAACEVAGVTPAVLEHIVAAGVISADVNWRHDLLKGGPVASDSFSALLTRIREAADSAAASKGETLTWAELTSRRMGDKRAIQAVMQAIADGRVKAIEVGCRLGDCVFRREDVTEYFGTPLLEAGMSIQQLAKLTGWKWESISHWIEEGLLESEAIQLRGKSCRVVMPHQLLSFRQTYVPLADLARGMGTKSSALSKLLPGIEQVGAKPLPDGAFRGGLIRMADLGRLAVIGARAGHDLFV